MEEYKFEKDKIMLFRCKDMKGIEKTIEEIFKLNQKILPNNKNARILIKPNFNNDLNAITGNSTDLRIIISVLSSLKKRNYKDITLADGPNCGIDHIGIDVFSRLCLSQVAKMFKVSLKNLNYDEGRLVDLTTGKAEIAKSCLEAEFMINLPKLKTHTEAGITISCKNYIGCFKKTEKRKMHDNLSENIVRINELIKTDLIIVDGLIGMEGKGPGNGIPKKVGVILAGHNTFITDFLCSKLMGLDYRNVPYLVSAIRKNYISGTDIETLSKVEKIALFKPGTKSFLDRILLNNFFIGIRFSKPFQAMFNKGPLPWLLFKMGVKQDKYIPEEMKIERLEEKENMNKEEKENMKKCLNVYCPIKSKDLNNKKCIKCMYCYQIRPDLIKYQGNLGAFRMQLERFGKYVIEGDL